MSHSKQYYLDKYAGSIFVIKAGGRVITDDNARMDLVKTVKELGEYNIRVLLIYGGGHAIDAALDKAGITPKKIDGRRITNATQIEIIKATLVGDLGFRIATSMRQIGLNAVSLSNIPASWGDIQFRDRDPEDYGYDGAFTTIHPEPITNLMHGVKFVVCPCLGVSEMNAVNINADNVATAIAARIQSRKLIFLSDVDGVRIEDQVASVLTDQDIPRLIEDGTVQGGMQVKLENCLDALNQGVKRIHLINGFQPGNLAKEIYAPTGVGTMLIKEEDKTRYTQEIKDNLKKAG